MVTVIRPYTAVEHAEGYPESLTSVSDIGKKLNGRKIKADDYLTYERLMVSTISSFLFAGESPVCVLGLEAHRTSLNDSRLLEIQYGLDRVLLGSISNILEQSSFGVTQELIRLALRECLWFRLRAGQKTVHFGYDLYVYLSGGKLQPHMKQAFLLLGMQVASLRALPRGHREPHAN